MPSYPDCFLIQLAKTNKSRCDVRTGSPVQSARGGKPKKGEDQYAISTARLGSSALWALPPQRARLWTQSTSRLDRRCLAAASIAAYAAQVCGPAARQHSFHDRPNTPRPSAWMLAVRCCICDEGRAEHCLRGMVHGVVVPLPGPHVIVAWMCTDAVMRAIHSCMSEQVRAQSLQTTRSHEHACTCSVSKR